MTLSTHTLPAPLVLRLPGDTVASVGALLPLSWRSAADRGPGLSGGSMNPRYVDVPKIVLERAAWVEALQIRDDEEAEQQRLGDLVGLVALGILATFCLLAWVLW